MVAVEKIEERRLGPRRPLDAASPQTPGLETEAFEIQNEILQPQTGPLPDRRRLGRLEVGVAQGRLRGPAPREFSQGGDDAEEAPFDQCQGVPGDHQFGVVTDEAGGCAEVEDRTGRRRPVGEGVEVGHDVVTGLLLVLGDPFEITLVDDEIGPHLLEGLLGNLQAQFPFGLRQGQPGSAPGRETVTRRKQPQHFR